MRVIIAAGGTGGHVFPAVAVSAGLLDRGDRVHWIGRPDSLEESEAKLLGIDFDNIPLQGLRRRLTLKNFQALWRYFKGKRIAGRVLDQYGPDVVFALGSYVSAPVIAAALSRRIPVVVHEQNVICGLVVEKFSAKVSLVLLNRPLLKPLSKGVSTEIVGMPLRPQILKERKNQWYLDLGLDSSRKTLFIFGGSQGARKFCELGVELAQRWQTEKPGWQILLQTGVQNLDWTLSRVRSGNVVPVGHIREMGKAYACADVVTARSGAVTCAELDMTGCPAVLVPYPHATRDHQMYNAREHAQHHPALVVPENELTLEKLDQAVGELSGQRGKPRSKDCVLAPARAIMAALDRVTGEKK